MPVSMPQLDVNSIPDVIVRIDVVSTVKQIKQQVQEQLPPSWPDATKFLNRYACQAAVSIGSL